MQQPSLVSSHPTQHQTDSQAVQAELSCKQAAFEPHVSGETSWHNKPTHSFSHTRDDNCKQTKEVLVLLVRVPHEHTSDSTAYNGCPTKHQHTYMHAPLKQAV